DVALLDAVAAAMQAGTARVGDGRVAVDAHRGVGLEVLRRDVLEDWAPGVTAHAVADRPARDPAVEDLHRVEELARLLTVDRLLPARVEHVGAGAVARPGVWVGGGLAERAAEHVEQPRQRVRA